MADTLKTMPIASLTDVTPDTNDKMVMYRDSDESAHVTTVGELSEGMNANISDAFSSSKSYAVGDYCIYNDTLYKCTKAHSGSWSASDFEAVTVGEELSELNTNVDSLPEIQMGTVSAHVIPSNSYDDVNVTFDTPFSKTPMVVANYSGGLTASSNIGLTAIAINNRSTTGFTVRYLSNGSTSAANPIISWIAIAV